MSIVSSSRDVYGEDYLDPPFDEDLNEDNDVPYDASLDDGELEQDGDDYDPFSDDYDEEEDDGL